MITNSRSALVGYFITSYPTRAHGIIVIYLSFVLLQVFEKDRDVLVAELRTSQLVNGRDSSGAAQLRDQIHTQVQ